MKARAIQTLKNLQSGIQIISIISKYLVVTVQELVWCVNGCVGSQAHTPVTDCDRLKLSRKKKPSLTHKNSHLRAHSQLFLFPCAHLSFHTHKGTIGHWGNNDRDMLMCANDVVISPYECKWSERLTLTQQGIRCGFTSTPACVCVCVC